MRGDRAQRRAQPRDLSPESPRNNRNQEDAEDPLTPPSSPEQDVLPVWMCGSTAFTNEQEAMVYLANLVRETEQAELVRNYFAEQTAAQIEAEVERGDADAAIAATQARLPQRRNRVPAPVDAPAGPPRQPNEQDLTEEQLVALMLATVDPPDAPIPFAAAHGPTACALRQANVVTVDDLAGGVRSFSVTSHHVHIVNADDIANQ